MEHCENCVIGEVCVKLQYNFQSKVQNNENSNRISICTKWTFCENCGKFLGSRRFIVKLPKYLFMLHISNRAKWMFGKQHNIFNFVSQKKYLQHTIFEEQMQIFVYW